MEGPPLSTIALGVKIQHMDWGVVYTVQFVALGVSGDSDVSPCLYTSVTLTQAVSPPHVLNSTGFLGQE